MGKEVNSCTWFLINSAWSMGIEAKRTFQPQSLDARRMSRVNQPRSDWVLARRLQATTTNGLHVTPCFVHPGGPPSSVIVTLCTELGRGGTAKARGLACQTRTDSTNSPLVCVCGATIQVVPESCVLGPRVGEGASRIPFQVLGLATTILIWAWSI